MSNELEAELPARPRESADGADRLADAAADSAARLRILADNLPHAMIYQVAVSPDGSDRRFTFIGQSCERLNGVAADAALADPRLLYELIAPEDQARHAAAEAAALRERRPFDIEVAMVRPDGERRWSRMSSAPRILPDGTTLWDGIQLDITDSRLSRDALANEQNRLALAVEATGLGLWDFDIRTGAVSWDDRVRDVYGVAPETPVDYGLYMDRLHPDDRELAVRTFQGAVERGEPGYRMEHRTLGDDGSVRWVLGCARILRDAEGQALRLIGSTLDITERKRAEERLQLMVNELNHRVKNTMAVVQAIVARTLRANDSPEAAARDLTSRLMALARAHDLLTAETWEGADLGEVAARSLEAVGAEAGRVSLGGPPVRLRPTAALTFALVIHELATNALKYGALSAETGRLEIAWRLDDPRGALRFEWRESGGPEVSQPTRRGFGTQLLQRGFAAETGGEVRIDYRPEGLVCTVFAQMESLAASG